MRPQGLGLTVRPRAGRPITGSNGADLKEDGFPVHPPEVGNGVTAVTTTRQQLQAGVAARTQLL